MGIKYEKAEIFEDTVLLLRYNCPEASCDVACYGWPDLHRHVKTLHQKMMCDLCTRNKKVFTHEHELFTAATLRKHERYGDDNPGAIDQSGFKGHPECGFCRQRFYGDDELYAHCRDKHERCHVCDRRDAATGRTGNRQQYFVNYDALEIHFSKDHFLCPDQECLEKKFVVFDSEMDLKAHQLEAHPDGLTKDARRDARKVDMSGFDYRTPRPAQDSRGGRREGRERGRGRDPNVDTGPLPTSSAQPMRRDELAYQRQLAIHSAQSVSNRTFGGQLTSNDALTARAPPSTREPETIMAPRTGSSVQPEYSAIPQVNGTTPAPSDLDVMPTTQPSLPPPHLQTPTDRARALRHASLLERASNLLSSDSAKLSTFRANVSSYKSSRLTARQLIDAFFSLFSCSTHDLGTLIEELADVFEVAGKREDLVKAWNDWRAINEDYPSLPGGAAANTSTSGVGGKRILKLKSSTAQSSRSAVSRHGSWGGDSGPATAAAPSNRSKAAAGRAGRGDPFPGLPASANRAGAGRVAPVPWVKSSAGSASSASPAPSSMSHAPAASSRPATRAPPQAARGASDLYPALPAAQKPGMNVSRPGFAGNPVRRGDRSGTGTPVNYWAGPPPSGGDVAAALGVAHANEEAGVGATKGKGKKKQTLIHWG